MVHKVSRYAAAGRGKSRGRTNQICAGIRDDRNADFERRKRLVSVHPHLAEHEHATEEDIAAYMASRQMKPTPATA